MIRIIKDNVILSIKEEDLSQYKARGFKKIEEVTKVTSSKDEKTKKESKIRGVADDNSICNKRELF